MFTSNVTLDPDDTEYDVRGTQMTGGPETKNTKRDLHCFCFWINNFMFKSGTFHNV